MVNDSFAVKYIIKEASHLKGFYFVLDKKTSEVSVYNAIDLLLTGIRLIVQA